MKKIIAIPLTLVYYLFFGLILAVFHPIQVVCYHLGGYNPHRWSVIVLNRLLMLDLLVLGCRSTLVGIDKIPKGRPLIIVSNHQNLLDISPIIFGLRDFHPKFISKKELGKGIPSISYNLNKGGSLLIDRKKGTEAVHQIFEYGKEMNEKGYSVVIYPEGTRSRTGKLRPFKPGGLKALVESMPDALILPFVQNGNYKVTQSGMFPLSIGHSLTYTALPVIDPANCSFDEMLQELETKFKNHLEQKSQAS